jgi:hypothetical protein
MIPGLITGKTNFLNAFWVVPTGVGRSRFMSCAIIRKDIVPLGLGNVLLPPKRWSTNLGGAVDFEAS